MMGTFTVTAKDYEEYFAGKPNQRRPTKEITPSSQHTKPIHTAYWLYCADGKRHRNNQGKHSKPQSFLRKFFLLGKSK